MPYTDNSKLPPYIEKLSKAKRDQWVAIWNDVYKKTGSESKAFAAANSVVLHGGGGKILSKTRKALSNR